MPSKPGLCLPVAPARRVHVQSRAFVAVFGPLASPLSFADPPPSALLPLLVFVGFGLGDLYDFMCAVATRASGVWDWDWDD